jgi:hypothetical protein
MYLIGRWSQLGGTPFATGEIARSKGSRSFTTEGTSRWVLRHAPLGTANS